MSKGTAVLIHPYRDWHSNDHEKVISSRLSALGYDILRMSCDGVLAACDRFLFNAYKRRRIDKDCADCQCWCLRQEAKIAGGRLAIGDFLTESDRREITLWAADIKMSEWTAATFDGLPVWRWATSSVGSQLRELPVRDDDWTGLSITRDVLHATATATRAAQRFVEKIKPGAVVLFNGRFASTRPFLEIVRAAGIPVICHEVGDRTRGDCRLMPGYGVGERGYWDALARLARRRSLSFSEARAVNEWIVRRFHDPAIPRYSQIDSETDSVWSEGSPRVLIAPSSNDENRIVDGFDRPGFEGLEGVFQWIIGCSEADPAATVVVRAHPNLSAVHNWGEATAIVEMYRRFAASAPPNVKVILPHEKASSYSFLREADLVVSDFSTMTLEGAALGIPAISLGRSRYWESGCFDRIENVARPWRDVVNETQAAQDSRIVARARRCMWNMFFAGEFPVEACDDPTGRISLGDAIEAWGRDHSAWWESLEANEGDAEPLEHEIEDLWPAIERARGKFVPKKAPQETVLVRRFRGAQNRLRRAARVLLRGA